MFNRLFLALCLCCVCFAAAPVLAQSTADGFSLDAVTTSDTVAAAEVAPVAVVVDVTPPESVVVTVTTPADLVATVSQTAAVVGGLILALIFAVMEMLKGLVPGFAAWSASRKRAVSILLGGAVGAAISVIPVADMSWYIGLIVGLLAGAGATGIRALGKNGPARILPLILVCVAGLMLTSCGTTFTAQAGQQVTTAIKVGPPGQILVKVADKTACTVNTSENGKVKLQNVCKTGSVPWYEGATPSCIADPCQTGTLTHNADATVGCR